MKVIIQFSDFNDFVNRTNPGDVFVVGREEKGQVTTKERWYAEPNGKGGYRWRAIEEDELRGLIQRADHVNAEVIGHSGQGGKTLQSDKTDKYPIQYIAVDKLAKYIEQNVLKDKMPSSTVTMLSCQAANGSEKNPSLVSQLYALFDKKPEKVTARDGFVYIDPEKLYSLSKAHIVFKSAHDAKWSDSKWYEFAGYQVLKFTSFFSSYKHGAKNTPLNEEFVLFKNEKNQTLKIDKQLYDVFHLIEKEKDKGKLPPPINQIINKKIENLTKDEFIALAKFGSKASEDSELFKKSTVILSEKDDIELPKLIKTDLSSFKEKDRMLAEIKGLKEKIDAQPGFNKPEVFKAFLDKTADFIEYRQARNYSISDFQRIINEADSMIKNNGKINAKNELALFRFSQIIQSTERIKIDSEERNNASGLALPSRKKAVVEATTKKNATFSEDINDFLKSCKEPKAHIPHNYKHAITGQESGRWHIDKASVENFKHLKDEYANLRGDALKSQILTKFKLKIEEVTTKEELATLRQQLENKSNDEYNILAKGQGLFTKISGMKTSSVQSLEKLFKEKEEQIEAKSRVSMER